jgi:hypothetical protein
MNLIVEKTRKNDAFDKVAFDLRNCSPATFLHFEPDFKVEATMRFHTVLGQAVGTPHSKMHFMMTRRTVINANMRVIFCGRRAFCYRVHFFPTPTRRYAASG